MKKGDLKITISMKRNTIEDIENNIDLMDINMQVIEQWLISRGFN